jgi:hypothetical protein
MIAMAITLTERNDIIITLSNYEFKMFNKGNDYKGETTVLNKKDIDDILEDMRLGAESPVITVEGHDVTVKYPDDICLLKSTRLLD